jgi:hypothetical protein
VQNNFYVWDPKMGGEFGVGAYVLISDNGMGGYDIIPASVSPESQYIQSGQGFLVRPSVAGVAGSITIKESDKSATAATDVFRTSGNGNSPSANAPKFEDPRNGQALRVSLQVVNADRTSSVLDEVFSSYKSTYSDKMDALDAVKLANIEENLAIVREQQTLMAERKTLPKESDVIELKLWNTAEKTYLLEFNPVNLSNAGLSAMLEDKYLKTSVPVSLSERSQVTFRVTSDAASARADRFRILLGKGVPDALTGLSKKRIAAYPNPVSGRSLNLAFVHQPAGLYQVTMVNSAGQIVFRKNIQHNGGSVIQSLQLDKKLISGSYQLKVSSKEGVTNIPISATNELF